MGRQKQLSKKRFAGMYPGQRLGAKKTRTEQVKAGELKMRTVPTRQHKLLEKTEAAKVPVVEKIQRQKMRPY